MNTPAPRSPLLQLERALSPLWLVLACLALLALRKPWALHTPQFWAEDGTIFMVQDEHFGLRALLTPYNGYLHLIPRTIAWIAGRVADIAWAPAVYNALSFAVTAALFARFASPRVQMPGKPWLMLALVLTVGSGEPLINLTNLQWITAFFLVLHLFTDRPATPWQRAGDLSLLAFAGLNGPFAALLAPFFAWRAWRDRHADAWLALAVIGACALTQATLVIRFGLQLEPVTAPFQPLNLFAVLGSRLVVWPLFGPVAVRALPPWAHAFLGVALLAPLLARGLRRDPAHPWRLPVTLIFCLITAVSVHRSRMDTWFHADMANGDRYFYIPRVLVTWLLIAECLGPTRLIAWSARALCLLGLALHLPHFVLPAPPDYHWAQQCDPVRRGVPANIPTLPEGWIFEYPGRPNRP